MLDDSLDETQHLDSFENSMSSPNKTARLNATHGDDQTLYFRSVIRSKDDLILALKKELQLLNLPESEKILKHKLVEALRKNKNLSIALQSQENKIAASVSSKVEVPEYKDMNLDYRQKYLAITNQQQVLRQELQTAKTQSTRLRKCLLKEIGSEEAVEFAVQHCEDSDQSWRGRAQQIAQLQKQLRELQKTSKSQELNETPKVKLSDSPSEKRRLEALALQDEIFRLKEALEEKQVKLKAAKSRVAVLEAESQEAKTACKILKEKSVSDDALIKDLRQFVEVKAHQIPAISASKELERLKLQCERQKEIIAKLRGN